MHSFFRNKNNEEQKSKAGFRKEITQTIKESVK